MQGRHILNRRSDHCSLARAGALLGWVCGARHIRLARTGHQATVAVTRPHLCPGPHPQSVGQGQRCRANGWQRGKLCPSQAKRVLRRTIGMQPLSLHAAEQALGNAVFPGLVAGPIDPDQTHHRRVQQARVHLEPDDQMLCRLGHRQPVLNGAGVQADDCSGVKLKRNALTRNVEHTCKAAVDVANRRGSAVHVLDAVEKVLTAEHTPLCPCARPRPALWCPRHPRRG